MTCVCLLGITFWLWANPDVMLTNSTVHIEELSDAIRLLDDADSWRQKYIAYAEESEILKRRKREIEQWLPPSVDWVRVDESFRDIASSVGVDVISLRQLQKHVGSRVGIVECECKIRGTFRSICELMQQLSSQKPELPNDTLRLQTDHLNWHYPAWCHDIQLQRLPVMVDNQIQCAGKLMIRVPYAAEGSAAANLLTRERNDA